MQLRTQLNQSTYLPSGNYNAQFGGMILQSPGIDNVLFSQNSIYFGTGATTYWDNKYQYNGPAASMQFLKGSMYFYTGVSGIAGNTIPNWSNVPKVGIANNGGMAIGPGFNNGGNANADGVLTVQNNLGLGITNPSAQLHTTGSVIFQGLTNGSGSMDIVSIDGSGQLWRMPYSGGGIQNYCTSAGYLPRTYDASGNLTCSQIYDDGTSVGIVTIGSFYYNWPGGLTGSALPPSYGYVQLAINGVTSALAYFATSDRRYKKNITNVEDALTKIKKLQGVAYQWDKANFPKMHFNDIGQIGFIAQDVEKFIPEAVIKDKDGYYSMNYTTLIPKLNEDIKEQEKVIEELKNEVTELKTEISNIKAQLGVKIKNTYFSVAPNPVGQSTQIRYNMQTNNSNAIFLVYDLQGKIIKQIAVPSGSLSGNITLARESLTNGVYFVSLSVNNLEIQTEKVILAN